VFGQVYEYGFSGLGFVELVIHVIAVAYGVALGVILQKKTSAGRRRAEPIAYD
jgi:hypothetical protein